MRQCAESMAAKTPTSLPGVHVRIVSHRVIMPQRTVSSSMQPSLQGQAAACHPWPPTAPAPVQELLEHFPGSTWLIAQAALAQYNLRNFDESQALYEDLVERDPYRIEVHPAAVQCP